MSDRPILLVDAMNLFVRSWAAYPTMSTHGYQMGGAVGFLKTLGRICNEIKPIQVIICWEGGGSTKRRKIYSEYKMNRKPEKLNRFYGDDIPDSEENKQYQIKVLLQLLKNVPVFQVYASGSEGDDVIAYLCRGRFKGQNKIIASSDKDMYQLLDDETTCVYNLHKKTYILAENVFEEFGVLASNFAIAKALCGDGSDNIPGIKGLGFKSLTRRLPFVGLEHDVTLEKVFDYCEAHKKESIHYRRVLEGRDDVKRNWRLVYLDDHTLSNDQAAKIDHALDTFKPKVGKMELMRILAREGVNDFDPSWFFYALNCIDLSGDDQGL